MSTIQRKQAPRLPRPAARYWKGKAPKGTAEVESDSDEELEQQQVEDGDVLIKDAGDIDMEGEEEENEGMQLSGVAVDLRKNKGSMNITLKDVSVSKEGKVIVAGRLESGKTEMEVGEEESEEEEEEEEEEEAAVRAEEEEESSEYESESEDEAPKPLFRPVFVPKRARATIAEKEALAEESEEVQKKREQEAEERRKQSHDMVAESIRRELAEKEKEDEVPDIDDTDGLDPTGEFEAWRLRELGRIKREKEEELLREQEREEIERRRALPEEQRLKEDMEKAEKSRKEKSKGQQKFLQKYWHKGAFHQDEEILKRHDYTEGTESTVDVSLLPKVMQVKNFGKRSRTKYTHLLDQDTTAGNGGFGGAAPVKHGGTGTDSGGCFLCGGPHLKKDCPQNQERSGANAIAAGSRMRNGDGARERDYRESRGKLRDGERGHEWENDGRNRSQYRDDYRDRRKHRDYSGSRSRSPIIGERNRTKERRDDSMDDHYREKRRRFH